MTYSSLCYRQVHDFVQSSAKLFEMIEIIRFKKILLVQFYEAYICQVMIFRLYTVYDKHEMIKIGNQTREKSEVLSLVLE